MEITLITASFFISSLYELQILPKTNSIFSAPVNVAHHYQRDDKNNNFFIICLTQFELFGPWTRLFFYYSNLKTNVAQIEHRPIFSLSLLQIKRKTLF